LSNSLLYQVNGGQRAGSLSPEFEDVDSPSGLPLHLVYARPPSATGNHHSQHHQHPQQQQQYFTAQRRDRYSADGVSLLQVSEHDRPVEKEGRRLGRG